MKKLIVLAALVAGVFAVYHFGLLSPERRSCRKLGQLCGQQSGGIDKCIADLESLAGTSQAALMKLDRCVAGATSCSQGVGCLLGAGFTAAGSALTDFVRGLGRALENF
jgi:hypothetical protein